LAFASPLSHSGYVEVGAPIKGKDGEHVKERPEVCEEEDADARTSSSQARTREPQALCKRLSLVTRYILEEFPSRINIALTQE
jgi:hypothetical protein